MISFLQRLENENLIYIVPDKSNAADLFYHGCTIERQGALAGQYILSDGSLLGIQLSIINLLRVALPIIVRRRNQIAHEADIDYVSKSKNAIALSDVIDAKNYLVEIFKRIDLLP